MTAIPDETLESIAADMEAAVSSIGAKYGVSIRYRSPAPTDMDYPEPDGLVFEVSPLDEHELTDEARNGDLWRKWLQDEPDE